jgi:hypothetical protein
MAAAKSLNLDPPSPELPSTRAALIAPKRRAMTALSAHTPIGFKLEQRVELLRDPVAIRDDLAVDRRVGELKQRLDRIDKRTVS